jgi:hypothetical protein
MTLGDLHDQARIVADKAGVDVLFFHRENAFHFFEFM